MPLNAAGVDLGKGSSPDHRVALIATFLVLFTPILASSFHAIDEGVGVAIDETLATNISAAAIHLIESTSETAREKLHFTSAPKTEHLAPLFKWSFLPGKRGGFRHDEMNYLQRFRAQQLVRSTLSEAGFLKWNAIVALETVLRDLSKLTNRAGRADPSRTPGQYTFAIVGDPAGTDLWGWRVEGHHISLRFLLQGNRLLSSTPAFVGAAPTVIPIGPSTGMEVLGPEETIAIELAESLHGDQKKMALRPDGIPRDILHGPGHGISVEPQGVRRDQLDPTQVQLLDQLIDVHLGLMASPMMKAERNRIDLAQPGSLRFCWWGPIDRSKRHSYRIHGPTILIELVRVSGDPVPGEGREGHSSGHVHIVRRDPARDLDFSPLRDHLEKAHNK